jgi:hypothetical protein
MDRVLEVGSSIIFVDAKAVRHNALVTIVWGQVESYKAENGEPGCNLVFISGDPDRNDSCGRQMERSTSVVHKTKQPAHGMYWCWPDE